MVRDTLERMLVLTGPAGSGKTARVLEGLRAALQRGGTGARLLVPTATLAQHFQNQLAREGFVLRGGTVQTLSAFVGEILGGGEDDGRQETIDGPGEFLGCAGNDGPPKAMVRPTGREVLYLVVEAAARRINRAEFAGVVDTPGFCAALAGTMEELASAGCDAARLAAALPDTPLAAGFLEIYRETERQLESRGLALRGKLLQRASERIAAQGAGVVRTVWLDGFHALPEPELQFIAALSRRADVTLTIGDADLTEELRARLKRACEVREERLGGGRTQPAMVVVKAPRLEREVEEIARRILEQSAAGRPFREMGIIVRSPDQYAALLRSTLGRFGIPARFYFDGELDQHPAIRFLTGAVDAMLGGWDHAQMLAVLRLSPRFADLNALDRFDFAVREQIPNAGVGGFRALAQGSELLEHKIDKLAALEEWRSYSLEPKDWTARFMTLRNLFRPARPENIARMDGALGQALAQFDEALDAAALAFAPAHEISLETYWRAVKAVLRIKPLRVRDDRRNVVHVLPAYEARQWVLPVVFVCGMVEKLFPQIHRQDAFLPEGARLALNRAGIRLRTAAEFEREEKALFDSAVTRATMSVTLTYPEFDARGDRNLKSLFLDEFIVEEQEARSVRPELPPLNRRGRSPRSGIEEPGMLAVLLERTGSFSPTGLEQYVQCPFRYFGGKVLRLRPAPLRPEDRLDLLTQGNIVHQVLARWYSGQGDIVQIFEEVFSQSVEDKQIPPGYHTERLRYGMLNDLVQFSKDTYWKRGDFESQCEQSFELRLDGGIEIRGRIDRLDKGRDGRTFVIDYKYSNAKNTAGRAEDANLLQAPLYLLAAERQFGVIPAGMVYIGLRGKVKYAPWNGDELAENWRETATEQTLRLVQEIRSGRTEVKPADPDKCEWCDCRDVCRVEIGAVVSEAADA